MSIKLLDCTVNPVAKKVLAEVKKILDAANLQVEGGLEPALYLYVNGRERGYIIKTFKFAVAFAENRNSDDIVIYHGKVGDFTLNGSLQNDKIYESAVYFRYNEVDLAASVIASEVLFAVKEESKNR